MTEYSQKELKMMGQLQAQAMLIGLALAIAVKDLDDPRRVLKDECLNLKSLFRRRYRTWLT